MAVKSAYGASAEEIGELFSDYLEGGASNPAIALSTNLLGREARNALEKTFESFGYKAGPCTYVTLFTKEDGVEGADITLDPQALYLLMEGLDPLYIIATDKRSAETLARAYRASFDLDATTRLMGRSCAVFENLTALLTTPEGKQRAWRVLKSLV